eukprot:Gb_31872 [translate_table: standard]
MPIMDGHEATKQLRMMGVKTPIIALTGNALQSDKDLFLEVNGAYTLKIALHFHGFRHSFPMGKLKRRRKRSITTISSRSRSQIKQLAFRYESMNVALARLHGPTSPLPAMFWLKALISMVPATCELPSLENGLSASIAANNPRTTLSDKLLVHPPQQDIPQIQVCCWFQHLHND